MAKPRYVCILFFLLNCCANAEETEDTCAEDHILLGENFFRCQFQFQQIKARIFESLAITTRVGMAEKNFKHSGWWLGLDMLGLTVLGLLFFGVNGYVFVNATWFDRKPSKDADTIEGVPRTFFEQVKEMIRVFFQVACAEELFWRAFLLPSPSSFAIARQQWGWSLVLYVGWIFLVSVVYVLFHLVSGYLLSNVARRKLVGAQKTFSDPRFLAMCSFLTLTLDFLYYAAGVIIGYGYVWPCIIVHWLLVSIWLNFCWGSERMRLETEDKEWILSEETKPEANGKIPGYMYLCSFLAGHGILRKNREFNFGDCISLLVLILGCLALVGAADCQSKQQTSSLASVSCWLGYCMVIVACICSAVLGWKEEYYDWVTQMYSTQDLKHHLKQHFEHKDADDKKATFRDRKLIDHSVYEHLKSELEKKAPMNGGKELVIGTLLGVLTTLAVLYSFVFGFQMQNTEGRFQMWICLSMGMFALAVASAPLAVLGTLSRIKILREQLKVVAETDEFFVQYGGRDGSPETRWNSLCSDYMSLDQSLRNIGYTSVWLFLSFNGALLLDNISVAIMLWTDPHTNYLMIASVPAFVFQLSFIWSQTQVTSRAKELGPLALKAALTTKGEKAQFTVMYANFVAHHPTGWHVGPLGLLSIDLLIAFGKLVAANVALRFIGPFLLDAIDEAHADKEIHKHNITSKATNLVEVSDFPIDASYQNGSPTFFNGVHQIKHALTTTSDGGSTTYGLVALIVLVYFVLVVVWVFGTGFLRSRFALPRTSKDWGNVICMLLAPALLQEVLWRVILLPSPDQLDANSIPQVLFVSLAFAGSYVFPTPSILNVLPGISRRPGAFVVFRDPRFLVAAALLGSAAASSYYASGGSIWPSVVMHWLTAAIWLVGFNGSHDLDDPDLKPDHLWSFWAPRLQKTAADLLVVVGLATVVGACFISQESGVPLISHMFVAARTRLLMQTGTVVAVFCAVMCLGVSQHIGRDYRHAFGIASAICVAVGILNPACVDTGSLTGPSPLCWEGPRSVFHATFVTVGFTTGLLEMWLQRWLEKPGVSNALYSMRAPLRWLSTLALVCLPVLRRSNLGMNPSLAVCEWILFLSMLLHTWSSRFEDEASTENKASYETLVALPDES